MENFAPPNLQRICLVRLSALGDVCLMVPLVRTLQHAFPQATISWITSAPMLGLLEGLSGVEFVVADKANHPFGYWNFYRRMKNRSFDVLLCTQASFRAHFLYPLIRAPIKIGFNKKEARDSHRWFVNRHLSGTHEHLLDSFLRFARALGATESSVDWRLSLSDADRRFAEEHLKSNVTAWIAVNPVASKPERTWLPDRYAAVIDACIARWDVGVVLTGRFSRRQGSFGSDVLRRVAKPGRVLNLI